MPSTQGGRGSNDALARVLQELEAEPPARESAMEARHLILELEVRQLELEVQNHELREARSRLEESRARYADLYDFAPVAYLTLDRNSRIDDANLTAAAFFGVARGALIGRPLAGLVPPEQRAAVRAHVAACFADKVQVSSEIVTRGRRSQLITAQMTSTPLLGPDGRVTACKSALTDISAIKRAQEILRFLARASALFSSSFDYIATLADVVREAVPLLADACVADLVERGGELRRVEVAIADPKSRRLAEAARLARPRAARGTPLGSILDLRKPLLMTDCRPESLTTDAGGFDHEAFVRAIGARSLMYAPIVAHGRALGALTFVATESGRRFGGADVATAEDLARRAGMAIEGARLYEDAQRAIAARQEVLSFVSHDLKNPLMGILIGTDLLLRAAPAHERRRGGRQLRAIRRNAEQMRRMVDDLLDASSIEARRLRVDLAERSAAELLADACAQLQPLAKAKDIELRVEPVDPALRVRCDQERVTQVLSNLVGNAIKFTPHNSAVTLRATVAGDKAQISVCDTGPGISATMMPRLFERYAQARETARRGRGLGLFISKGIVEAHGGTIWADSQLGAGASFHFTLPLVS